MPSVRPPYATIFEDIIAGIRSVVREEISVRVVDDPGSTSLDQELGGAGTEQVVIALGPSISRSLAKSLGPSVLIVGAVPPTFASQLGAVHGIHLGPSPRMMLAEMRRLAPGLETVYAVQVDRKLDPLFDQAISESQDLGLELVVRRADSRISAARAYREIMHSMRNATEALWLLDDASMDADATLPAILRQAWDSDLVVVSNNLQHVSRGALMALYPDNRKLGEALGKLALGITSGESKSPPSIMPLTAVRRALNLRTVRHLRLDIGPADESRFDLLFPRR